MPTVAEMVSRWSRMGRGRKLAQTTEPKSKQKSRNPSFVDPAAEPAPTLGARSVPEHVKEQRLMSPHGVSLAFMKEFAQGLEQNVYTPGTRLVILTQNVEVELADGGGGTRVILAGDTARILSEDTGTNE
jgi:hypothetical protein